MKDEEIGNGERGNNGFKIETSRIFCQKDASCIAKGGLLADERMPFTR